MKGAKERKKIFALILAAAMVFTVLAGCDGEEAVEDYASTEGSTAASSLGETGSSGDPESFEASPENLLSVGEAEEGTDGESLPRAAGFVPYESEGVYNPDLEVKITRSARPIRRIVKQDIYGRELSDDFYFYRNLLNSNEKKLYDQIYANAVELDPYFEISTKVPRERADDIYLSVRLDNPDLFWMDAFFKYSWDGNGNISSMTLQFYDMVGNIEPFKQKFYACVDSIAEHCMGFSDIEKVKYCHDLLTNINIYNWGPYNQSAYSALAVGQTVCAGFSSAFTMLMQRLGVPCASIRGDAGEAHLWNLIKIDGDYYEMDVTWDNPDTYPQNIPHTYYYNYFNVTSGQIANDHSRYAASSGLPYANGTYYAYYNFFGNAPGSDFSNINYGNPGSHLPLYPEEGAGNSDYSNGGDEEEENVSAENDGSYTRDKVEDLVLDWSDEQWDSFWNFLEENLTPEEVQRIDDMDWDEFIDLIHYLISD